MDINAMGYYRVVVRKKIVSQTTTWITVEDAILSKINQSYKEA